MSSQTRASVSRWTRSECDTVDSQLHCAAALGQTRDVLAVHPPSKDAFKSEFVILLRKRMFQTDRTERVLPGTKLLIDFCMPRF